MLIEKRRMWLREQWALVALGPPEDGQSPCARMNDPADVQVTF